ncbi:MAG: polysaccharide biosynthesis/export family protein [Gemmatimonadetes bacterium]|nr:polysaccharide biosynthesis/export family protein [Gemmatimonadota bacterium]
MLLRTVACLGALLLSIAAVGPAGASAQADATVLRLRAGDAVRLQVQDEPGLSADYPVVEDGTVLLPLVGRVPVAGRPFPEVREAILAAYAGELRDAAVAATPVLRIPVLGEVRQPGLLPVDPTFTLADVLAAAGGLTPDADADDVSLVREGSTTRLSLGGSGGSSALVLQPGDQILVGRRSWASRNLTIMLSAAGSVLAAVLTSLILR